MNIEDFTCNKYLLPAYAPILLPAYTETTFEKERRRVRWARRRAIKKGLRPTLYTKKWLQIVIDHGWRCHFCNGPFETLEHLQPIGLGGNTSPENCVPACHLCNQRRERFCGYLLLLDRYSDYWTPRLLEDLPSAPYLPAWTEAFVQLINRV